MSITSYNVLQSKIEAFCDNHYQVKKFGGEFYSEINNFATEDEKFPIIFSSPIAQRVSDNVIQFDMDIYCLDIIKNDRSNLNTILSDTNLILNDLHLFFKLGDDVSVDVIGEPSLTPINNSLLDYAAGWVMRITFEVDNYGPCQIPFIDAPLIPVEQGGNIFFQYVTCETLQYCDTIITIQSNIDALSATTTDLVVSATTFETQISALQTEFYIGVNFIDAENFQYVAPEQFKITSIDNPDSLVLTITVNGSPYVLGNTIALYDDLLIIPNTTGFIKLNCEIV